MNTKEKPGQSLKRSQINKIIKSSFEFFNTQNFILPKWAKWTKKDWLENKVRCCEIFNNSMGWDVTEQGKGDFENFGMVLFTIRNGEKKGYCEKLILLEEKQICPTHFHWHKTEDIINRGGSNLIMKLYNSTKDEGLEKESNVKVQIDGIQHEFKAGEEFKLETGQSVCLEPYTWHAFWPENGKGKCLIGEVSKHNDDKTDNCFLDKSISRYPSIIEDEEPEFLIVGDYEKML